MAKGPVAERLSGLDLSQVWDILLLAVKDIALLYGGSVLGGGVIGGAFFGSVGAIPGAAAGATAGGYIGSWVLTILGLGSFIDGMNLVAPEAFQHYEKGFREAWGPPPIIKNMATAPMAIRPLPHFTSPMATSSWWPRSLL